MVRRNYAQAQEALDRTSFENRAFEDECRKFHTSQRRAAERNVIEMVAEKNATLATERDELEGSWDEVGKRAQKALRRMERGGLTHAEAGDLVDELRAQADHLDGLEPGLRQREDSIAAAAGDPLGYLDRMFERAPSLRLPDWPW